MAPIGIKFCGDEAGVMSPMFEKCAALFVKLLEMFVAISVCT